MTFHMCSNVIIFVKDLKFDIYIYINKYKHVYISLTEERLMIQDDTKFNCHQRHHVTHRVSGALCFTLYNAQRKRRRPTIISWILKSTVHISLSHVQPRLIILVSSTTTLDSRLYKTCRGAAEYTTPIPRIMYRNVSDTGLTSNPNTRRFGHPRSSNVFEFWYSLMIALQKPLPNALRHRSLINSSFETIPTQQFL